MKKKYAYTFMICIAVFFFSEAGVNYSQQPPFNYTGADGPSTCAQCHGNFNTGGGGISASGLPTGGYVQGQQYDFNITLTHPASRGRWGFSIAARDANNQPVGSFSSSNPNAALNNGELSHFGAVFQTGTLFIYDNLRWTAPVNPTIAQQNITFFYIGNAANGDRGLTGDFIYSGIASSVLVAPNLPPVITIASPANHSNFSAGTQIVLNAVANDSDGVVSKVEFYNHGIKFFEDSTAPYGLTSNNEIEPGNYILTAKAFDNDGDSAVSDTVRVTVTGCAPAGSATGDGYLNITGAQVADLLNDSDYPNNPDIAVQLGSLEYASVGNDYGARLRGYICAPLTGNYIFYIAGDDQAGLFLSTDDVPASKVLVAYNETPVGFHDWFRFPTQKSAPIKLVKGVRYYFETLHKQASGSNHLSVGWIMPDGTAEAPIPGTRLSPVQGTGPLTARKSFQEAIKEMQLPNALAITVKAAPNPSASYFTITMRGNINENANLLLTDVLGRVVEKRMNIAANGTLQLGGGLKAGIYFLEVTQGSNKQKLKLIKK